LEDTSVASNKRERELARMRAERQAARRAAMEAQRRQRRNALLIGASALAVVAVVVVVAVLIGTGSKDKKTTATPSPSTTTDTVTSSGAYGNTGGTGSCTYKKAGNSDKKISGLPPATKVRTTGTNSATIVTNRGTVQLSLLTSKAPCTVNSFAFLAQQKYFNDTKCHRLTTSGIYVLQCGDPTGSGSGGPGYQFGEENLKGATYPAGTVAMARTATPGTNGSQFFLVYKDSQLPADYTPFGTITGGLDVLTKVAAAGVADGSQDGTPKQAVTIDTLTFA
jgi:peptidyl-prolyl cis-trans isomerase B (cyclophilin B)